VSNRWYAEEKKKNLTAQAGRTFLRKLHSIHSPPIPYLQALEQLFLFSLFSLKSSFHGFLVPGLGFVVARLLLLTLCSPCRLFFFISSFLASGQRLCASRASGRLLLVCCSWGRAMVRIRIGMRAIATVLRMMILLLHAEQRHLAAITIECGTSCRTVAAGVAAGVAASHDAVVGRGCVFWATTSRCG